MMDDDTRNASDAGLQVKALGVPLMALLPWIPWDGTENHGQWND